MKNAKIACVFGGTGFVGRQVVRELALKGYIVKVATRVPERAFFLKPCGVVGQVAAIACSVSDAKSVAQAVCGADVVVNCIGILFEKKKGDFARVHTDFPQALGKACKKENVRRLVHISALGVDKSTSKYAFSKREGEKKLRKAFPGVTILRPSIIFGPDDSFFNMFANMAQILPFLPLIGGGKTQFQPVYVGDVADAVMKAVSGRAGDMQGEIFELGGPETVNFREIYEILFEYIGIQRPLIPLPFFIAKMQGAFLSLLPKPPLTMDQVESLKTHSIVSGDAKGFEDLNIAPSALDTILPDYLWRYRPGGRFADKPAA